MNGLPVLILGGGGHARVVASALCLNGLPLLGLCDPVCPPGPDPISGLPVLGGDDVEEAYALGTIRLANGIGSLAPGSARRAVFERCAARGRVFVTVVHPAATVAVTAVLGEGAQVMAGAIIQPGTIIGRNAIINTRAAVDHDCWIGDHVHIAPGAVLSGGVTIGSDTHIGTGAVIIQGIAIGAGCLIGAGAVITAPVADGTRIGAGTVVRRCGMTMKNDR